MAPTAGLIVGLVVRLVLSVETEEEDDRAGMGDGGGKPAGDDADEFKERGGLVVQVCVVFRC